jgi:hypothetical protein
MCFEVLSPFAWRDRRKITKYFAQNIRSRQDSNRRLLEYKWASLSSELACQVSQSYSIVTVVMNTMFVLKWTAQRSMVCWDLCRPTLMTQQRRNPRDIRTLRVRLCCVPFCFELPAFNKEQDVISTLVKSFFSTRRSINNARWFFCDSNFCNKTFRFSKGLMINDSLGVMMIKTLWVPAGVLWGAVWSIASL